MFQHPTQRTGAVAVESAVILSVFLLIIFGVMDLSLAVLRSNVSEFSTNKLSREFAIEAAFSPGAPIRLDTNAAAPRVNRWIGGTVPTIKPSELLVKIDQSVPSGSEDTNVSIELDLEHQSILPRFLPWDRIPIESRSRHLVLPLDSVR